VAIEQQAATTERTERPNERIAVLATSTAFFMIVLDTSIVNLALPSIGAELGSPLTGLQWIVDGYALVFACLLLSAGSLADRHGAKRVFLAGIAIFTFSSALCCVAPATMTLQAARVLQGIGAAFLLPTSLALLNHAVDEPRRKQAISTWAGAGALGIALGPLLGGLLIDAFGWRSIFAVNLPIGVAGFWLTLRHLPESARSGIRSLDPVGQAFAITALGALTYALISAGHLGPTEPEPLIGAGVFLASTAGFLLAESVVEQPMLPLGFFGRPAFASTAVVGLLHNVGIYGMIFVLSIAFHRLLGVDPLRTGLMFLPLTGGLALGTRLGSRMLRSWRPQWSLAAGHFMAAIGAFALAVFGVSAQEILHAAPLFAIGLGAGTTTPAMNVAILDSIDRSQAGLASGLLNGARQCGGVIGVAVLGALLGEPATFVGARSAFLVAAGALALAGVVAISASQRIGRASPALKPSTIRERWALVRGRAEIDRTPDMVEPHR
jgi:MFS transporter, DHA2 family, methylenomycin A resistance protein